MKNITYRTLCLVICLLLTLVSLAHAEKQSTAMEAQRYNFTAFLGLSFWLIIILIAAGIEYIAIGAAVLIAEYVVYHIAEQIWLYYTVDTYVELTEHA